MKLSQADSHVVVVNVGGHDKYLTESMASILSAFAS